MQGTIFKALWGNVRKTFLLSALYMYLNVHFTQTVNQVLHARNIPEICYQPLNVDIDYQFPHLYILINTGKKDKRNCSKNYNHCILVDRH